ncbi:hypothetical protein I317_05812 [Kwoniella heveanensis CBS 569]|uniref:Myb-like domain-containing protein n=1 Tax=Kwoniella heveanensis BCC8398 TaxID=1296120 RepID=A0A1B9H0L3_9TREE|nr:hypothetical protein I316_01408 [Kwoniella heveanensis BCC8398]OCF40377.1 hypothetical protein I317_05812 [Kwoniella heveanensis CBS 569]
MPPKRKEATEYTDNPSSVGGTPKKSRGSAGKTAWTPEEDALFIAIIDDIVRKNLWNAVKVHPQLAARQNGGIMSHWKMLHKKL